MAVTYRVDVDINVTLFSGFGIADVSSEIQRRVEAYAGELLVGDDFRRLPIFGIVDAVDGVDTVDLLELQKNNGGFSASDIDITGTQIAQLDSVSVE